MFFISDIFTTAPEAFKTPLQEKVYETLDKLKIPYKRVDTDEAITMNECVKINDVLNMEMVKTLFLCDRKKTAFYLYITAGNKPFSTKNFSHALGISRVSFAPSELMEKILGTKIGAATVFSALLDTDNNVQIVFDKDITKKSWYGCSDGTTTGYIKIKTEDIIGRFISYTNHSLIII